MDIKKVGKAIAYLRKRAGYTQKDLADRIGISDKAVSKWERGLGLPDISYFGKLSVLLDIDTDSLLAGDVFRQDKGWAGLLFLTDNPYKIGASTLIYDKPLVYYLLSYFLLAGIKKIVIMCDQKDVAYLQTEFGDGSKLGINLYYCNRDCEGRADTLKPIVGCSNVMVVCGRSFIYGVGQTRFFQRAMVNKDRLTFLSFPKNVGDTTNKVFFDENRKVINELNLEKIRTQYDYYGIPVFFCPFNMLNRAYSLIGDDGIICLPHSALQSGLVYTEVPDRGYVEISIDTPNDILEVSNYVRMVQKWAGMNIYCIEEIAWRRGMISIDELEAFGKQKANTEYGEYILSLCHR